MTSRFRTSAMKWSSKNAVELVTASIGLAVLIGFTRWWLRGAGAAEVDWLPGALLLLGLLASMLIGTRGLPRHLTRPEIVTLSALAGFAAWALMSIGWAAVRADAWDGGNRALLYLAVFSVFLLLPWRRMSMLVLLSGYVAGITIVAAIALSSARHSGGDFIAGRLSYPTGYPNANAALFLSGFWVAMMLATRRAVPAPLRVAAAAAAAVLPQVALLSQSRGSLASLAAAALVILSVIPGRVRTAVGLAATAAILVATRTTHSTVFHVAQDGKRGLEEAVTRSAETMALTATIAAGVTLVWTLIDARRELSAGASRVLGRVASGAAVLIVAAACITVIASDPEDRVRRGWNSFTAVSVSDNSKPHFSTGLGSNRYDFWRVAMAQFEAHPITGVGADNFAVPYMQDRRSIEEPSYPHSLEVMVLSQLGVVGAALFVIFIGGALFAALPRSREEPFAIATGGAALAGVFYLFAHASVDWFWEIPGLGAPAFALLGAAISVRTCGRAGTSVVRAPLPSPAMIGATALVVVAFVSCALPWLAYRQTNRGVAIWPTDPARAYHLLSQASTLNPLSARPDLVAGAIAARTGDNGRAIDSFARSLARNPHSWYAQLELGLSESMRGHRVAANAAVARAVLLNPQEPPWCRPHRLSGPLDPGCLTDIKRRIARGARIDPSSLDAFFTTRIRSRTR